MNSVRDILVPVRRWFPRAMVALGLALLIFVSAQYGAMYYQQRRLAAEWERQQKQPVTNVAARSVRDGLTRILIPRIKLDAVVVEGTGRKQLLVGPGHMADTARPGESGNSVITAHRDTFFRHIYELNKGDVIELRRNGSLYRYQVTGKRVVDPDDMAVVQPTNDAQLTLITCYPTYYIGPAPERLVVFSKLLQDPSDQAADKAGNP